MNSLDTITLAAHFPAVAPQIRRALENDKPLAAKLDSMASHLVKIAESMDLSNEIQLVIFAHNLAALAEQVAYMENNLEMPA